MFTYQKSGRFFAQIAPGLEDIATTELANYGGRQIKSTYGGLYFSASQQELYQITLQTRLCNRILVPLLRFDCHSDRYLYKTCRKIPWEKLLSITTTFAVSANTIQSNIRHSHYAALKVKDAIADRFMDRQGQRPDVCRHDPDGRIHLHLQNNKATVYWDAAAGSLHRRRYRKAGVTAPMQETLAAAVIHLSNWQGKTALLDPMCGSGTLVIEAMLHYCRIPSQRLLTKFGLRLLPEFDPALWKKVNDQLNARIRPLPGGLIHGSDRDKTAIAAARKNCSSYRQGAAIHLTTTPFSRLSPKPGSTIICNPPYGIRLGGKGDINSFLRGFGAFLKNSCKGSTAYIFLGNRELHQALGLRPKWKRSLKAGGLKGELQGYDIY